ncbi:peptide chain release factor N(5)-glutamine methyltransferase [Aurantiacibacter xanthus]|uniref:Release factor glutamine methyltransferase n=1 Tax=Aurantiacibacter xanthus TaxID=1784712 RepID=A0A3A1P9H9_9SPHN|nr:peptide chain release factor N(5)-glutamine methyltransferase [Aurantiacibacter xanthus]RIV88468.1 peptide chain release factor N(5)-glutamine methyltransferase [Aurantiacibacter xanthus]
MTIADLIRQAAARLEPVTDTARLDAELLMAHVLGVSRSDLLLRHMREEGPQDFAALIDRRAAHEPVAYIIGEQEFYGRPFAVTPGVLIPRADSETTVQAALDSARPDARVLDCGTGSGALLLTFLAERADARGVGIDASEAARHCAQTNTEALGLAERAQITAADWSKPGWADALGQFDLVISNPPYVEADAALNRQVRDWEPAEALFAGAEGLDDYRLLIPQLRGLLKPGGVAVLEIGWQQAETVSALAKAEGFTAELRRDLAERPRALILR